VDSTDNYPYIHKYLQVTRVVSRIVASNADHFFRRVGNNADHFPRCGPQRGIIISVVGNNEEKQNKQN
jgi:hypothetical protein